MSDWIKARRLEANTRTKVEPMSDIREAFEALDWLEKEAERAATHVHDCEEGSFQAIYDRCGAIRAALQSSQTAPAVPEGVRQALKCFDIARFEGWDNALTEGSLPALRDIYERRISWAERYLQEMLTAAPQPDHSPDGGEVEPVAGLVQVTSECFKQVLPWDEAKRQHHAILSASESLGAPGKGAELIPLYTHPAQPRNEEIAADFEAWLSQVRHMEGLSAHDIVESAEDYIALLRSNGGDA